MKIRIAILSVVLILTLSFSGSTGCNLFMNKEPGRMLNDQNIKAGEFVANEATKPDVVQAGKDIRDNATGLANSLGSPETPAPYTPSTSQEARTAQSQAVADSQVGGEIVSGLGGLLGTWFPWAGTLFSTLVGAWAYWLKLRSDKKTVAGYRSIQKIGGRIKDVFEDGKVNMEDAKKYLDWDELKEMISEIQETYGVAKYIKSDLRSYRAKGHLKK